MVPLRHRGDVNFLLRIALFVSAAALSRGRAADQHRSQRPRQDGRAAAGGLADVLLPGDVSRRHPRDAVAQPVLLAAACALPGPAHPECQPASFEAARAAPTLATESADMSAECHAKLDADIDFVASYDDTLEAKKKTRT